MLKKESIDIETMKKKKQYFQYLFLKLSNE